MIKSIIKCISSSAVIAVAYWFTDALIAIERHIQLLKLTGTAVVEYRRQHALPLLQEFRIWLDAHIDSTPPTGLLGKAMSYMHKQWARLIVYVDSPYAGIDNNPAENAIRPFALGRKNWLFAGAPSGARASAVLYSLVETAKANEFEPYRYLRFLFERLPYAKTFEDYRKLTPQHLDRKELDAAFPQWC